MQRKTIATTAFLIILVILALLISFFVFDVNACNRRPPHKPHHPPLGKFIHITFTCSQTGKPIVGLPVTIGTTTDLTDEDGCVVFGSGYLPGTYTYTFKWWDRPHSETVTIDCSEKDWYYKEDLLNPEIHKTFKLNTAYLNYPPIEGLDVTLVGYGTQKTDATGYVKWSLDYPFSDYTLEWTWNGVKDSEPVYWADFVEGVWSKTNELEPKSGGGV